MKLSFVSVVILLSNLTVQPLFAGPSVPPSKPGPQFNLQRSKAFSRYSVKYGGYTFCVKCNGAQSNADKTVVTGEVTKVTDWCLNGGQCPYVVGDDYFGGLCDGKTAEHTVCAPDLLCYP